MFNSGRCSLVRSLVTSSLRIEAALLAREASERRFICFSTSESVARRVGGVRVKDDGNLSFFAFCFCIYFEQNTSIIVYIV